MVFRLISPVSRHLCLSSTRLPLQLAARRVISSGNETESSGSKPDISNMLARSKKRVFLFMKGNPAQPNCGYSGAVVQVLEAYDVEYDSFDVLSDEDVRREVKTFSDWPTIPQLYKDGKFVGGCDILLQMHQSGELEQLFQGCHRNKE